MKRLLMALAVVAGLAVPVTAAAPVTGPAAAAAPDIVCNGPTWWYDEQTRQYIDDQLPSGDSGPYGETVPAEDPGLDTQTFAQDTLQVCYDVPLDPDYQIVYLRLQRSTSFPNNAIGVQITNGPLGPQGPAIGYNADPINCSRWHNWCPVAAAEYPFELQTEFLQHCYSGYPGKVSFYSVWTGQWLTTGTNIFYNSPGAPINQESGQYFVGAGIGPSGTATAYLIPGLCGASG